MSLIISKVGIKNIKHLDDMKAMNPKMRDDFIKFITKYPTKKFSRILIPMDIPVPAQWKPSWASVKGPVSAGQG